VISGPLVSNWAGVFAAMARDDAIRLAGPDALAEMLAALMADPKAREALGRRALAFAETQRDVIAETWSLLSPQVPRCS
jgi:3-deoxy-D-manno-octulosonic-acid transferase